MWIEQGRRGEGGVAWTTMRKKSGGIQSSARHEAADGDGPSFVVVSRCVVE
jgi:hypothetical protein